MPSPSIPTVAVVLAAGGGTRFAGPTHKLLAPLGEATIVEHSVRAASAARIGPVLVVSGAVQLPPSIAADPSVRVIHNHRWEDGQATSLSTAIAQATTLGASAVVVGLGDQPFVEPDAWRLVAAATAPIAVATYGGRRRNPVRLHSSVWAQLPTGGDAGARDLIRCSPGIVSEVPCPGSPVDIDTLEDLRAWQSKSSTNSP